PPTPEPLPEQPVAKKPTPPEPVIIAQPAPVVLPPAVPIPVVKPVTPPTIVTQKPIVPVVPPQPDLGESRVVEIPKEPAPPAVPPPPAAEEVSGIPLAFSFFGSNISMHYDEKMNISMGQPVDNQKISAYWKSMAQTDYKKLINQSLQYKDQLQLNDWGYFLFLNMTAENILNDSSDNDRNLLVWFMLTKSGYEAKIGFRDDLVTILLPASSKLFGRFYFSMEGKKFYAVAPSEKEQDLKKIFTYKASYPGSDKSMDFMVRSYPLLAGETSTKKLSFNYDGKEHVIAVQINQNNIPYFEYYPQTEVQIYADAPFPKWMENSMLTALLPLIKGKSEVDAVNLLLRFSQTAFEYKTDQDQFNREKFLFPEETVFYPYSDCEDRSIMFSYLVRNLLGLEVILLHYPNHIATAVLLKGQPVGDQVIVNDKHFTICDPTYINASIGKAMPQFRGVVPEVFTL
ncbi:MAG: hypothetical protein KKA70_10075, partial [Proteobacteria bacterium]|nr:hypothetical protein [Pseudomonadota bacterium]